MEGIRVKRGRTPDAPGGDLRIDFHLLAGDVEHSRFKARQVRCRWQARPFEPASPVGGLIERQWRRNLESAQKRGLLLFDGPLARLVDFRRQGDTLQLTLQPTSYRVFSTTNLMLDTPMIPRADGQFRSIRQLAGRDVFGLPSPYLANPLNVIATIVSRDGVTFVPRRSLTVFERPGTLQASVGGALDTGEHPAAALRRETMEEWGLAVEEDEITFFALGISGTTGEPDLLGMVQSPLSADQICRQYERRAERDEFTAFAQVPLTRGNAAAALELLITGDWSQPSDQAAFYLTLTRQILQQNR
jgi:8-oxo-dGTP pyrophosphatase MutT (NUDIX family)